MSYGDFARMIADIDEQVDSQLTDRELDQRLELMKLMALPAPAFTEVAPVPPTQARKPDHEEIFPLRTPPGASPADGNGIEGSSLC